MENSSSRPMRSESTAPLAIVGIGAAVGGLESMEQFFAEMPSDLGIAIVVVQHLDTDGSDVLSDVVAQLTSQPVQTLNATPITVEANRIYVAPERCQVELSNEGLAAIETVDKVGRAAVIDYMFQSLASNTDIPVVGIVLSGEGNDGTLGLKAISDAGGMTIAQHAQSATQDEMPRSAVLAGHVDHALLPSKMPALLLEYVNHVTKARKEADEQSQREQIESVLLRICDALLQVTEHDFRRYKTNTLLRRVSRRMRVLRLTSADDYLRRIQKDREETHTLFQDLLISVTEFFRDPDVFVALANLVIPKLIENAEQGRPIRIWTPGCATGEEAYTLAMLLREGLDDAEAATDIEVQVFGTDIDQRALNSARAATYSSSIADHISEPRMQRFFEKKGDQYRVVKEIRDMCVFSVHNLISDPPYSQMDLISCRNLLIYLGQPLQLKLIPLFHFALRPCGYLLLGPSESLASHIDIFRSVDQEHLISQRKPGPAASTTIFSATGKLRGRSSTAAAGSPNEVDVHQISQRIVLDEFAPRYAVVNEDAHLVCSSTGLERYFEFPDGPFHNNVVRMAKPGLRSGLRASLRESQETLRTVTRGNLTLSTDDGVQRIELVVQPMPEIGEQNKLFMLVFHDLVSLTAQNTSEDSHPSADAEGTITQLEQELDQTRTDLEKAVQDLEGSNEELKSSNEELLSMNEELLSANEELKTSKEEVQSGMEALSRGRNDLQNLLDGMQIATIFLDARDIIKSFTPSAVDVYNIKSSDIGRPLSDITHKAVSMPALPEHPILAPTDESIDHEIQTTDGHWFSRRVLPYQNENRPTGMILTFVDISDRMRTTTRLAVAHDVTQLLATADSFKDVVPAILEAVRSNLDAKCCSLWLVDPKSNELYCAADVAPDDDTQIQAFVEEGRRLRLKKGTGLAGHVWETGEPHWIEAVGEDASIQRRQIARECGFIGGVALPIMAGRRFCGAIEFFTDYSLSREQSLLHMLSGVGHEIGQFIRRSRLDDKFRDEEARKSAILESALDCVITMDIYGKIMDFNAAAERTFQITRNEASGRLLAEVIIPPESRDAHRHGLQRFLKTGESELIGRRVELVGQRDDGHKFPVEVAINVSSSRNGTPFFTANLRDITEQKRLQATLAESEQRLAMALKSGGMAAWEWTPEKSVWTDAVYELLGIPKDELACPETFFQCVHEDDLPALKEVWAKITTGKQHYDLVFRIRHPDGTVRWLAGSGDIERNKEGSISRVYGLNWDVTREHQAADALKESERHARQANVAKSEFLANMSHEIRTPMTAVLGYTDLLVAKEEDSEKKEYLETIKRNGKFLLDIINDILDLSKIESGMLEVFTERFSLHNLVADVRSTMNVRAREKNLDFHVEYDGKLPEQVVSDPKRVRQILINLVGNAIKFTQKGGVRLIIRYVAEESPLTLQFQVSDTGIGISEHQQSRLFEEFSQADSSVCRNFGGTGLGLAISQRLAQLLGGSISLKSTLGQGSTFTCRISAGDVQDIPLIDPSQDFDGHKTVPSRNSQRLQCRVLVVDDRRDVRFLTRRILADAGADVSLAEDGVEALQLVTKAIANKNVWDLILLDMQMPRLDGYQTAAKLKEVNFEGPIIALTADAMYGDVDLCLQNGCDDYLSKPIDSRKLIECVAQYTGETITRRSDSPAPPISTAPEASTNLNDPLKRSRILLVDDSVDACTAMQKLLELQGFEVTVAFDGASAIQTAIETVPDAILLDISLPDMNGYDVLRQLKAEPLLRRSQFIALTGDCHTRNTSGWQKAGFHHHLTKPADLNQLIGLLSKTQDRS